MSKNEAKKHEPTTAITPPPASQALEVFDYGGDEGAGFENQDNSDRKLPMLKLLQANSPEVEQRKGLSGQWWNTVTMTAHDTVRIVAATTAHAMIAYVPRDDGGGFRGRYQLDDAVVKDAVARNGGKLFGKLSVPQPKDIKTGKDQPTLELVETFEVIAAITDGVEPVGMAVIPFSSTKIKSYREFNTQVGMFQVPVGNGRKATVPLFAHDVVLGSRSDKNAKGSFFVPTLTPAVDGDIRKSLIKKDDPRYVAAKQLRDQYNGGVVRAGYETMTEDAPVAGAGDAAGESAF